MFKKRNENKINIDTLLVNILTMKEMQIVHSMDENGEDEQEEDCMQESN